MAEVGEQPGRDVDGHAAIEPPQVIHLGSIVAPQGLRSTTVRKTIEAVHSHGWL